MGARGVRRGREERGEEERKRGKESKRGHDEEEERERGRAWRGGREREKEKKYQQFGDRTGRHNTVPLWPTLTWFLCSY